MTIWGNLIFAALLALIAGVGGFQVGYLIGRTRGEGSAEDQVRRLNARVAEYRDLCLQNIATATKAMNEIDRLRDEIKRRGAA